MDKESALDLLIGLLRVFNDDKSVEDMEEYDEETIVTNTMISNAASEALIDDEGKCIWESHRLLSENGFYVFPGERDRFGWVTGCIQTKKGIIVFG